MCAALALFAAACDGDDGAPPTTAAAPSATAAPSPTPAPELGSLIGERADLPPNGAIDLAQRYHQTSQRAPVSKPFAGEANVGDAREFRTISLTSAAIAGLVPPDIHTVRAELLAKSEHAYFYVDEAIGGDVAAAQEAALLFEEQTWPAVTSVFGEPLSPGVDGDPRIIVLHAPLGGVGGYHSDDDRYLRAVRPFSNEAEMVYMDRTLRMGGAAFNVVLAHELQHLIHGSNDQGEESWTNEGLSETASGLAGGSLSSIGAFEARPETQLNDWDSARSLPHYGAGAAFYTYLAGRVGGDAVLGAIAREPGDGAAGVEAFLASIGQPLTFSQVFADWVAANILNQAEGPYGNPAGSRQMRIERDLGTGQPAEDAAPQFGTHYYSLLDLTGGEYELRFSGGASAAVLPAIDAAHPQAWWANAGDDTDTRLTREIDLTTTTAPMLQFSTWFDIEGWYDWGYVSVSTDDGVTWDALPGEHTLSEDPVEKAYGPGYTRRSGGGEDPSWVDEFISLEAYAGQKILLRFEYVTDEASHGRGWAVDDIRISGTSLDDRAAADPEWSAEGWVPIDRPLPQTWMVRLIATAADGAPFVLDMPVSAGGEGVLRFNADGLRDPVIAIAGTAEGTNATAPYRIELARP